ncbi:MAG: carboxypeptidase-like regulatory domain-containing protein [Segetibacter sp.]
MRKHLFLFVCILLSTLAAIAQSRLIKGRVLDEAGQPVSGASVVVRGTSTGTVIVEILIDLHTIDEPAK